MSAVTLEKPVKAPVLTRDNVRTRVSDALKLSARIFHALAEPRVVVTLGLAALLIGSAIGGSCTTPWRNCRPSGTPTSGSGVNCCWSRAP